MVHYTEETVRKTITIANTEYVIAQPFVEGHVCTANEANALNQLLAENCRNNFAEKVKKAEDGNKPSQEDFDKYVAGYEFGVRSVASSDPVEKEMRKIVEASLAKFLASKGLSKAKMPKEEYANAVENALQNNYETLRAQASQIIALRSQQINF